MKTTKYRVKKIYEKFPENEKDLHWRVSILSYQIGDLIKWCVYDKYYGAKKNPQKAHLKSFVADVVAQILLFVEAAGLDLEDCIDLGLTKLSEREYDNKVSKK